MDVDLAERAEKAGVDQRTHVGVAGQAVGAGYDHGRQTAGDSRARSNMRWASRAFKAIRAWVRTCLPASKAASVTGQCR